jgi:hypothetical protein
MVVALVDISEDYSKDDSPRWDHRTQGALLRRELVGGDGGAKSKLTKKGRAYLEMALYEYAASKGWLDEAKPKPKLKAVA